MADPQVPGYTQVANTTGAFQGTPQTPGTQDQDTLAPAPSPAVAPLASPTFTGTVTLPDGSTFAADNVTFATTDTVTMPDGSTFTQNEINLGDNAGEVGIGSPLYIDFGIIFAAYRSISSPDMPDEQDFILYNPTTGNEIVVPTPGDSPVSLDGEIWCISNKSTGTTTIWGGTQIAVAGSAGTFTVTIAGYTTATFAWNVTAVSMRSTLSDGTHGPSSTKVAQNSNDTRLYSILVPGGLTVTVSGGSGGCSTETVTPTIDGQNQWTLPAHCGVLVHEDGNNFYTLGSVSKASNTSGNATVTTPTPTSGTAFTPNANQDCELSFAVSTAASFSVTYGPATGAENTIISTTSLPIGTFFNKRIPAGWMVIITGTIADLENILAVSC